MAQLARFNYLDEKPIEKSPRFGSYSVLSKSCPPKNGICQAGRRGAAIWRRTGAPAAVETVKLASRVAVQLAGWLAGCCETMVSTAASWLGSVVLPAAPDKLQTCVTSFGPAKGLLAINKSELHLLAKHDSELAAVLRARVVFAWLQLGPAASAQARVAQLACGGARAHCAAVQSSALILVSSPKRAAARLGFVRSRARLSVELPPLLCWQASFGNSVCANRARCLVVFGGGVTTASASSCS